MNRPPKGGIGHARGGCDADKHNRGPTTTTLADRSARERDEWRAAGDVGSGLERARVALALAASRSTHALVEGFTYE